MTLVDRCSRFLICTTAKAKKATLVSQAIIHALANQPVFTMTPDRGKEFAKHKQVTDSLNEPSRDCRRPKTLRQYSYEKQTIPNRS